MGLTFNDAGDLRPTEKKVSDWRTAREASPTAADYAGTFLAHGDADLTCRIDRGKLVVETSPAAKGRRSPQTGHVLHAHLRLECDLPLDVMSQIAAMLVERAGAAKRLVS